MIKFRIKYMFYTDNWAEEEVDAINMIDALHMSVYGGELMPVSEAKNWCNNGDGFHIVVEYVGHV